MGKMDLHHSSETGDWETPDDLFDHLNDVFQFDLDVCATEANAKVGNFISPENDTFSAPWAGTCWMNPPYGKGEKKCAANCKKKKCEKRGYHIDSDIPGVHDFVQLAINWADTDDVDQVVVLVPARVDTAWFQLVWRYAELILFVDGRLGFKRPGEKEDAAPFPSAIAVFGDRPPDSVFEDLTTWGTVIDPQHGGILVSEKGR